MQSIIFLILVALASSIEYAKAVEIEFVISGRELPNMDIFKGAPDPFIKIFYAEEKDERFAIIGETERLVNTNNPDWGDVINMVYREGANQRVRLEVWDEDVDQVNDYMGLVELTLEELVVTRSIIEREIEKCDFAVCGKLRITPKENKNNTSDMDPRFIHPKNIINYRTSLTKFS